MREWYYGILMALSITIPVASASLGQSQDSAYSQENYTLGQNAGNIGLIVQALAQVGPAKLRVPASTSNTFNGDPNMAFHSGFQSGFDNSGTEAGWGNTGSYGNNADKSSPVALNDGSSIFPKDGISGQDLRLPASENH